MKVFTQIIIIFAVLSCFAGGINALEIKPSGKSLVRISLVNPEVQKWLLSSKLDIACFKKDRYAEVVMDQNLIPLLDRAGIPYQIRVKECNDLFAHLWGKDEFGAYHTYNEITMELQFYANNYSSIAALYDIGDSIQGRNIWAMKISDNVRVEEDEPEIFYVGCHHAREIITPEVPMEIIKFLLQGYGSNPQATFLVDNRQIWIVPLMNPDGHQRVVNGDSMWRKNCREISGSIVGVDNNRNYGFQWGYDEIGSSSNPYDETYRGAGPFSEPENLAIKNLFANHRFVHGLSYHSYGRLLIIPWGYINADTPDHDLFMELATEMVKENHYEAGNPRMGVIYNTNGDFGDWVYGDILSKPRCLGFTFEIGDSFAPPESQIPGLIAEVFQPSLYLAEKAGLFLDVEEWTFDDSAGDNDGMVDPGERGTFKVTLKNRSLFNATNIQAVLSTDSPYLTIINGTATFPDIPSGQTGSTNPPYFEFSAAAEAPEATKGKLRLHLTANPDFEFDGVIDILITRAVYTCPKYFWPLNLDPGWSRTGDWAFGRPTGQGGGFSGSPDPQSGYTGFKVFGTNLNGDYSANTTSYLTTGPIDCSNFISVSLEFYRWLNIDASDTATVEVSQGTNWVKIWQSSGEMSCQQWQKVTYDITDLAAGRSFVKIRFGLTSDWLFQNSGWNIDDIAICGYVYSQNPTPTPTPTGAPTYTPSATATPSGLPSFTPSPTPTDTYTPQTQSPTATRTPTPPTITPTPSPTSAGSAPKIILGGYWDTAIYNSGGGTLNIIAVLTDPGITSVKIYLMGVPTSISLFDDGAHGDFGAGDGIFGFIAPLGPGISPQRVLLEIVAHKGASLRSSAWPYLVVK